MRRSIERCHKPGRKHQCHPVCVQVKAETLKALRAEHNRWSKIFTSDNAGKWVAVDMATGNVLAFGFDLIAVDVLAQTRGFDTGRYLLVRVPDEIITGTLL